MATYIVEIFGAAYPEGPPESYEIEATSREEARQLAKDRFCQDFPTVSGAYKFDPRVDLAAFARPKEAQA